MKRRAFIKAIFGTLAAVYAPLSLFNAETEAYDPLDLDIGKLRDMGHPVSIINLIEVKRREAMETLALQLEKDLWDPNTKGNPFGIPFFVSHPLSVATGGRGECVGL